MVTAKWMWSDACLISRGLAKRNPLRWSSMSSIEDSMFALAEEQPANHERPVKVRLFCDSQVFQVIYADVGKSIAGLQEYLPRLPRASADEGFPVPERTKSPTDSPEEPSRSMLWASFCKHLSGESPVILKWTTNSNPLCPPAWCSLEQGVHSLQELQAAKAAKFIERPVFLKIKCKLAFRRAVTYETEVETIAATLSLLKEAQACASLPSVVPTVASCDVVKTLQAEAFVDTEPFPQGNVFDSGSDKSVCARALPVEEAPTNLLAKDISCDTDKDKSVRAITLPPEALVNVDTLTDGTYSVDLSRFMDDTPVDHSPGMTSQGTDASPSSEQESAFFIDLYAHRPGS
mmetsp:Transcript_140545/g.262167  ORF Transcript_140545/g.262167 Transcript_140545/m.262167 type:complete len:347 (-) Transcript_140545:520-1560(-)